MQGHSSSSYTADQSISQKFHIELIPLMVTKILSKQTFLSNLKFIVLFSGINSSLLLILKTQIHYDLNISEKVNLNQ